MSHPALSELHQELRRCFGSLEAVRSDWTGVLEECSGLVGSLGNLAEQLRALSSVELNNTPLAPFPDLRERLQYKLLLAMDTVLRQFGDKMEALQSLCDGVSRRVCSIFQLYEQKADSVDLHSCVVRSSSSPSIADMMEWLQDAERYYRLQYIQRKNLLQTLTADDLTLMETAPKRWASLASPTGEEIISDVLLHVSFFMESE